MSFDFYAHEWTEAESSTFTDCFARIKLLAKDNNDDAKEKHKELIYGKFKVNRKKGEHIINPVYNKGVITKGLNLLDSLAARKPLINILTFPYFSFFLQFEFTLATPYISKDDEEFYICENPVRKDKVFKVPMVSGSNWKGNMRWVARKQKNLLDQYPIKEDSKEIVRLFGNDKGAEKNFKKGRLNFYPTFFNKIGLEVINPHDRKTKAGTNPIYIESVPEGAKGLFSLLYVPFDLMGKLDRSEIAEDLRLICDAVRDMMLTYGFSAKKSSGFGIAKNHITIHKDSEMRGIDVNNNQKQPKSKPEKVSRQGLKDLASAMVKKAEAEQDTFDKLKDWFESVISELEKQAASRVCNDG